MTQVLFILACIVLALIVMAKLPALEHFVRPIIDLLFSAVKVVAESGLGWGVFLLKALWFSHVELVQHLLLSPEALDPTYAIREANEPSGAADK